MNQANLIGGMPPMASLPRKPNWTLKDTKEVICERCGNKVFQEAQILRHLSKLVSGEAKDTFITIPAFCCRQCGTVVKDVLPPELKDEQKLEVV